MPVTTSYGMSYGWTKNSIAPSRFSFIPRCFFCKIHKADSGVQAPFLVAKSSLPPGAVGGMSILFQLIIGILKFPVQVSGVTKITLFGNIGSIFLFPARLVFYYDYRLKRPCGLRVLSCSAAV